jgi:hypothetical protein
MRSLANILILGLIACAPKHVQPQAPLAPMHPDLICPEGSWPAGAVPPTGFEAWCHQSTPAGAWLRQGTTLLFHNNGQKASQGEFVNDNKEGPWTSWYDNGDVSSQGAYAGGKETGHWTRNHEGGQRQGEGEMKNGLEHGAWVYWSVDGRARTEGGWIMGAEEGVWVEYDVNDKPVSERKYQHGRMTSKREL